MRTTLTLDPDLVVALRRRAERAGLSWKQVVNDAIRAGLGAEPSPEPREPYQTPVHDAGVPFLRGVPGVHDMLAFGEGEDYR